MKEIIFAGRSNVGKSTLITALTGKKLRIGRRPGVTRKTFQIPYQNYQITDMPGFGFINGISDEGMEAIKNNIVHYIEDNARNIALAVMVVNSKSFAEIVDRWAERNEFPVEVELFEFLHELDIHVVVAANKIDKVKDVDITLDGIAERLGMEPPWKQWKDNIVPVCAKKGEVGELKKVIQKKLDEINRER
ncbi:MAG: GTP-binding protein EngB [Candidatus Methanoperedens sp.]|nr:GTP-binding protein EngB [Candidatus Methanoperedens sp.]MCE8424300.1 GTP-binding protein EngB [Candidatus Methanoperedens sp.]MCE8426830.1 GTP-binding protein EngB [Candidatus Methanoperedens sp.]